MKKFYITTPIYYVNANPHIGHTYTTVAADCLARFHKIKGEKTFFLTGTDEHGAKIEEKANEAGMDPQKFADSVSSAFKKSWVDLNIAHDRFIRTTEPAHKSAVQKALQAMYDKGDIYKGEYSGLYCRGCEQYKNEKDLVDGLCPDHKIAPEQMSEECYMFKMSAYQDELLKKITSDEFKIRPEERKNEILSFYKNEKLQDISFSRKNVKWGIPLPFDASQTTYVWADAFLSYLTGLDWDGRQDPLDKGGVGDWWPANVQLMSKDILRVHATIWPAMLLSLNLPLPRELFIHGFFLIDGQKMSKSLGNVISPDDLVKKYGTDATRYLLMSATVFGHDGDIGWEKFNEKFNADLANGLGNLVSRVSNLLEKNEIKLDLNQDGDRDLTEAYDSKMNELALDEALKILWAVFRKCDEELTQKTPWKMTEKDEIKKTLLPIAQDILNSAKLLFPFMPAISKKIIEQFSAGQIKKGESLFPRI